MSDCNKVWGNIFTSNECAVIAAESGMVNTNDVAQHSDCTDQITYFLIIQISDDNNGLLWLAVKMLCLF